MDSQPREPAGSPDGGRFAAGATLEAPILLDAPYDVDEGSFYYPPVSRTARHLIRFWSAVPVPEQVLTALQHRFTALREAAWKDYQATWDAHNPAPAGRLFDAGAVKAWEHDRQQWLARFPTHFPGPASIEPRWARPLARTAQMVHYSDALPGTEKDQLASTWFTMPNAKDYDPWTLNEDFHLTALRPAFEPPLGNAQERLLARIAQSLDELNANSEDNRQAVGDLHDQVWLGQNGGHYP